MFVEAVSTHPAVERWAVGCAAGRAVSLVVLGSHWSGKTYTMYAAYRAALAYGLQQQQVAVPKVIDMTTSEALRLTSNYRVVLADPADYADPEYGHDMEGRKDYVPRPDRQKTWDEPELQAEMALRDAAWQQVIERLAFSTEHASIFTATSEWTLRRALPKGLVEVVLDRPQVVLEPRPRPAATW